MEIGRLEGIKHDFEQIWELTVWGPPRDGDLRTYLDGDRKVVDVKHLPNCTTQNLETLPSDLGSA